MSASKLDWWDIPLPKVCPPQARTRVSEMGYWLEVVVWKNMAAVGLYWPDDYLDADNKPTPLYCAQLPGVATLEQAKEAAEQWLRAGVRDGSIDPFRAVREWAGECDQETFRFEWRRAEEGLAWELYSTSGIYDTGISLVLIEAGFGYRVSINLPSPPEPVCYGMAADALDYAEDFVSRRMKAAYQGVTVACHFDRAALEVT
jgi:hypothetical protein